MSTRGGKLTEYRRKRDFSRTREPEGGKRKNPGRLAYVIQKHEASRLHYDLRLELFITPRTTRSSTTGSRAPSPPVSTAAGP